jgi:60 kDa SS-A/Ro ribonucleoprotein
LILGTDGGTFYVGERDLTKQNVDFLKALIRKDERLVVDTLVDVADKNRAAKNGPSIFALALLLVEGNDKVYLRATDAVNKVVRTSTHLFEFANYIDSLGGWGRAKRSAVAEWYTGKTPEQLAYQAVKYRQREGWTHRDLFRKVHPVGVDEGVGAFILGRESEAYPGIIGGFKDMQEAKSAKEVIAILNEYKNLPWETIPTQFLTDGDVWRTLFYNGALGQTALLRNVTRLSKNGALDDLVFAGDVAAALADTERIVKGRVHPVAYANALGIYRNGPMQATGYYGAPAGTDYKVNPKIAGALEAGFYNSFAGVEPANKATMVSVDVSGSMTWGAPAGLVGMNYLEAAAVMAMVTVRTEPYVMVNAFSTNLKEVNVSDKDTLDTVMKRFRAINMGGTDVAQPMVHAKAKSLGIDTFAVYTDNETWAGHIKPSQALVQYRQSSGRSARLAVVALAASPFTVADPNDRGMMDFVGFDSSAPRVLADFSAGRI